MRIHVIACEVTLRELCYVSATADATVDLVFLRKGLHDNPDTLRATVAEELAKVDPARVDAILLGYGLCSNGTKGLRAGDVPIIIPRAHDCITFFLGSRQRYAEVFEGRPGTYYYTRGWLERGDDQLPQPAHQGGGLMDQSYAALVERYGEDNARYLMEIQGGWVNNYDTACLIRMPIYPTDEDERRTREVAAANGWEYTELPGSMRLFEAMVSGKWPEEDFVTLQPGCTLEPSYDDLVLRCEGCGACGGGAAEEPGSAEAVVSRADAAK